MTIHSIAFTVRIAGQMVHFPKQTSIHPSGWGKRLLWWPKLFRRCMNLFNERKVVVVGLSVRLKALVSVAGVVVGFYFVDCANLFLVCVAKWLVLEETTLTSFICISHHAHRISSALWCALITFCGRRNFIMLPNEVIRRWEGPSRQAYLRGNFWSRLSYWGSRSVSLMQTHM